MAARLTPAAALAAALALAPAPAALGDGGALAGRIRALRASVAEMEAGLGRLGRRRDRAREAGAEAERESRRIGEELGAARRALAEERSRVRALLRRAAAESLAGGRGPGSLAAASVALGALEERGRELDRRAARVGRLAGLHGEAEARRRELARTESDLGALLEGLEARRGAAARRRDRLAARERRRRRRAGARGAFSLPLARYTSLDRNDRGITLRFEGARPIRSTGDGRISYVGGLSTYGNVIMIDHGGGTRSVLLGFFEARVEKGQRVRRDEDIALSDDRGGGGQVYFELRKGDGIHHAIRSVGAGA